MDYANMSDDELLAEYQRLKADPTGKAAEVYATTKARKTADHEVKRDFTRLEDAEDASQMGYDLAATAGELDKTLARTSTGPLAPVARFVDNLNPWGGKKAADLAKIERLANQLTLGNVSQLKGPLSDKDIAFLKSLAPSINERTGYNQDVIDAFEWASSRMTNYNAGLQAWNDKLGSPAAKNANGLTYNQWWGQWSAENLPQSKFAGSATKAQAAARKKKADIPRVASAPATSGAGWKVVQ